MNHTQLQTTLKLSATNFFPRWWRGLLIAMATLILCSCRWPHRSHNIEDATCCPAVPAVASSDHGMLPGPDFYPNDRQWSPPGITRPWPADEYIHDGGDERPEVRVAGDWHIAGLEMEDTVVHYDTLDGRVIVEPSNKVSIYAPRFGAVRQVVNLSHSDQLDRVAAAEMPLPFLQQNILTRVGANHQPLQVGINLNTKRETIYRGRDIGSDFTKAEGVAGFHRGLLPYENLKIIRTGTFEVAQKGALAQRVEAAITWSTDIGLQVTVKQQQANEVKGDQKAQATFAFGSQGFAKLRVIKIASKKEALSGETVEFTIRFDNVGSQPIGNVTLVDNLTPRLEFVRKSDQCSVKSDFSHQPNSGGSVILRWEIKDPIKPGEGGIVRFKCRVR